MSRWWIALTLSLFPTSLLAQHGGIQGQVVLDGEIPRLADLVKTAPALCGAGNIPDERILVDPQTRGVANVAIYLRRKPDDARLPAKLATVPEAVLTCEQAGCRFIPHMMVVRTGQKVRFFNRDGGSHHPRVAAVKNSAWSLLIAPPTRKGILMETTKPESVPISITCDIHPWMRGYWVVVDHPYAVVTGSDGKFKIHDLPEGEHEFRVWHERVGFAEKSLIVNVVRDTMTDVPLIKLKLSSSRE